MSDENKNYADDFVSALHGQRPLPRRGLPALHPREGDRWVNIAADDAKAGKLSEEPGSDQNLLTLPKKKLTVRCRVFDMTVDTQVEAYETVQNNCLDKAVGWILAREEWHTDPKSGARLITVKYIETSPLNPKDKDEKKPAISPPVYSRPANNEDDES